MNSKSILIIAYVFPPIAYGGTYRTLRLCKYLLKLNYKITVLTIKEQPDLHNDFNMLNNISDKITIVRTKTIDPWRSYQKFKGKILVKPFGKLINKIFSKIIYFFNIPDHMVGWVPFGILKAIKLNKQEKFDLIYTSSPPHSEQIIGLSLKFLLGKPWVADLRDPILGNIGFVNISSFERYVLRFLEKKVCRNADIVVANTKFAQGMMKAKYNNANIHLVYNSFDAEDFIKFPSKKYEKFTISHIGSIYGFRKVDHIFKAIQKLDSERKINSKNFKLLFVGFNDPGLTEEVKRFGLEKYVEILNMVSHKEALMMMVQSHLLLLIKGFGENSYAQIPGKLFEYLGTGNKILCIAPKESEAAQIINQENAGFVWEDNPSELASILAEEINNKNRADQKNENITLEKRMAFSSKKMVDKFHDIFTSL